MATDQRTGTDGARTGGFLRRLRGPGTGQQPRRGGFWMLLITAMSAATGAPGPVLGLHSAPL